jgi:hypothetical protein
VTRQLADGGTHRAVKVLWDPADLVARLQTMEWDASVHAEGPFYWGTARPGEPTGRMTDRAQS